MMHLIITGTRKGIGRYLTEFYLAKGYSVSGCSREESDLVHEKYTHYCLDVADEKAVQKMVSSVVKSQGSIGGLINNAGIAAMNHTFLTPLSVMEKIFATNVFGTFLFCREVGKVMAKQKKGRIVNFATVATPIKLEGESAYAASKAAVENMTQIMAKEFAPFGVTVNAIAPTPVLTDLIRYVPKEKMDALLNRQAIKRFGEMPDISNVIDFYLDEKSDFITGQVLYLGGVS